MRGPELRTSLETDTVLKWAMEEVEVRVSKTPTAEARTDALFESLECGLCFDRFKTPKECNCGHVFCQECLQKHVDKKKSKDVKCPLCSVPVTIPPGGVGEMTTHAFYSDLSHEIYILENENKISRGSCKFCSDNEKCPATVKCIACQVPMCEGCAANHVHNGVTNVVPIHRKQDSLLCDVLPKRETACDTHQTESLLLYCIACKSLVCYKCRDELHSDHAVADLADTAAPARIQISEVQSKVYEYLSETREALNDIEKIGKSFTENVEATKKHIETQVQRVIDHINREKERIIKELEEHSKEIRERLKASRVDMQKKESRAKAMAHLTENLLLYGNDAESTKYKTKVEHHWDDLQEEKLNRFGQGYKMNVQFFMNDGFLSILTKDLGRISVSQNLSPWTSRKSKPFDIVPLNNGSADDTASQMLKFRSAVSNDFSLKRSQIFAKFVDPKWNLETYKTCKTTGQTVTVWLREQEETEKEKQSSRASKRISMRSLSNPCLIAEVESFNEKGEFEYKKSFEKLPDGTTIRLAIGGKDTILLAVYPGSYASSVIGQLKVRSLSKKDFDGIYVAVLEKGNFVCGELRKIPIPEGPGFDFEITSRGVIMVKPLLQPNLRIYSTHCKEVVTDHGEHELTVKKIMESPEGEIVAVYTDKAGNTFCEDVSESGERIARFSIEADFFAPMTCEFKEARFDRHGNIVVHFQASSSQDVLYRISADSFRKEYLSKPEMLHKVDKLAILPDGRLCAFDKAQCVLMTLRYL